MLNTAITSHDQRELWSTNGWLPEEIGVIVEGGQFFCYEGEDLKLHLQRGIHNITVYSLIGMAIHIESGQTQKPHLVCMVNGEYYRRACGILNSPPVADIVASRTLSTGTT